VIRVLLVGDPCFERGDILALLTQEADVTVVGELAFGPELVTSAEHLAPQVVLIDTNYMISQILSTVAELVVRIPGSSMLILADPTKPGMLPPRRRPSGFSLLTRDVRATLIVDAVHRLAAGEQVIDGRLVVATLASNKLLNTRELEVLGLAAEGAPTAEIANRLYLSLGTVRNYLSSVIKKTGARNRIDAIRISRNEGWLR
jgi:two-component system, NarL family, response regulator DesR